MKQALLIIDMLNDFVREDGALEVPQTRSMLPALEKKLADFRAQGNPVVYVCDAHDPDDREFDRLGWPPHAVKGSRGARVVDELAPEPGDPMVGKKTYSGFFQTDLDAILQTLGVEELVLTGCVTNICILYTAADAVMRGYSVRVPEACVAAITPEEGGFALAQMKTVLGVMVEKRQDED